MSWRCPCCRAAIDPGAVRPAAELPADGRGREFFLPQPDVEAGTCSPRPGAALMLKSGKSGGSGSSSGGPLVGVGSFVKAAAQALANQEAATAAGAGGKAAGGAPPNCGLARSSSWALRAAERVLPEGASWAAATALASLRLRQLLNPKASPSLCVAAAVWANALALTLVGCALGAVLLRCFMTQGVRSW